MFLCLIIRMLERGGPTASSRRGSWPHSSPGTLWVDHKNLSLQILGWSSAWLRWMKSSRAFWSHARPVVPSYRRAWATSRWLEAFHVGCLASHRCHFQVTQTLFIASHCLLSTDNWLHSDQIGNKVGWKTRKKKRKKSQTMQPSSSHSCTQKFGKDSDSWDPHFSTVPAHSQEYSTGIHYRPLHCTNLSNLSLKPLFTAAGQSAFMFQAFPALCLCNQVFFVFLNKKWSAHSVVAEKITNSTQCWQYKVSTPDRLHLAGSIPSDELISASAVLLASLLKHGGAGRWHSLQQAPSFPSSRAY